jgi:hypothetical protein
VKDRYFGKHIEQMLEMSDSGGAKKEARKHLDIRPQKSRVSTDGTFFMYTKRLPQSSKIVNTEGIAISVGG